MIMLSNSDQNNAVLIVDNNVYETEMLNEWFRRNGFQVEVVTDSIQAVSRGRVKDFVLILIDMNLGDELGGFETIWLLKTIIHKANIALMSEKVTPEYKQKASSYGVSHWVQKPINKRSTPKEIAQALMNGEEKSPPTSWRFLKEIINMFSKEKSRR